MEHLWTSILFLLKFYVHLFKFCMLISSAFHVATASAAAASMRAWQLHGHAAASKPACMLHRMLLLQSRHACCMACMLLQQQLLLLRACVRAWPPS
jgi:hypothetical protein